MPRYVAFLRGINLGGRRLEMGRLRAHFEELGLANVATFIASGNVIFDTDADAAAANSAAGRPRVFEARIEAHLAGALGYEVDTFVRSLAELEAVAGLDLVPSEEAGEWRPHVIFLRDPPGDDVVGNLRGLETGDDLFRMRGREVYWLRRGRLSDSAVKTADLARALGGVTSTMRNMNTVRRIVAKWRAA